MYEIYIVYIHNTHEILQKVYPLSESVQMTDIKIYGYIIMFYLTKVVAIKKNIF